MSGTKKQTREQPPRPAAKRASTRRIVVIIILAAALVYAAYDLYAPRASTLRAFDADEVARLDTAMWRSYYERQRLRLFNQLAELLRSQYNLPFLRSNRVAYSAARAAFVFKDGRSRADYEKALPYLMSFYSAIREVADTRFDIERAARLELEWWIVHRERMSNAPGTLDRALAELSAEVYGVPAASLIEHGRLRAEAMTIRDTKAEQGGVTEEDWRKIEELLRASWHSLREAVN